MDIKKQISKMSLKDKIAFCTGADSCHTKSMEKYEIPAMKMSDGPHGLRCQNEKADMIGANESLPATCFPPAVTAGATWNPSLYYAEGEALGKEGLAANVSLILGPGCNIKRNPLCGRNFEYISEDPYLAGKMAASFIRGLQSTGASASLKHFAGNNQEYKRMNGNSQIDERTLREIYLKPFEIAVKEGKPNTVMCAYNKINGVHCSDSKRLLTDILRNEWGFDGMVVSDWTAINDRIESFRAGCDLNMPGGAQFMEPATEKAVQNRDLDEAYIDASVERILRLIEHSQKAKSVKINQESHHELAKIIAQQGAVLLKNEDNILPLAENDTVLIGYMAKQIRYQGAGSSRVNPTKVVNLTDVMADAPYFSCCDSEGNVTEYALEQAVKIAKTRSIAVVTAGLPDSYESESFDREHMRLPDGHNKMIEAVAQANPNTVVVLMCGSAMELPWLDKVKAVLYMGLPGQAGGQAIADLLTGKANPCGKLTESWPISYDDVISKDTFGKRNPEYREGIYVGYRYYDKAEKDVCFPFGHGLSYTTFSYSDLRIDGNSVSVCVTNTGSVKGAEVVQLYVSPPKDGIFRPEKELKGFERVELEVGESKLVSFTLDEQCFCVWNDGWKIPQGIYKILIGASGRDIRQQAEIQIKGKAIKTPIKQAESWYETLSGKPSREEWEGLMGHSVPVTPEPKKGQFTIDNSCREMKDSSLFMKIQYKSMEHNIAKDFGGKKDMSNPAFRMAFLSFSDCPMRSVAMNSNGNMNDYITQGMVDLANGHHFIGLSNLLKGLMYRLSQLIKSKNAK